MNPITPVEAVKVLTEAAYRPHTGGCTSDAECKCGAKEHNEKMKQALIVLGTAGRKQKK